MYVGRRGGACSGGEGSRLRRRINGCATVAKNGADVSPAGLDVRAVHTYRKNGQDEEKEVFLLELVGLGGGGG